MSWVITPRGWPISRVGNKRRQDDDDDGRADQGGQIGINSLNANLGKNSRQCRKDSGQQSPINHPAELTI
jgi:hypothetical protein